METLKLTIKDNVALITFSRPQAMNALNTEVFNELNLTLDELEKNKEIRALVFTGEGKAFIAGADIAEMRDKTPAEARVFSLNGHKTFQRIQEFKVPTIAAVNGYALGGGLEMAMSCDFILTAEKAKFGAPEVNLGLIPGFNGTQRLTRRVSEANAKYLLFTAEAIDAQEALRMGLVQKVLPQEDFFEEAIKVVNTITAKGPEAIKAVKRAVNFGLKHGFEKGSNNEPEEFAAQFSEQGYEGMAAFLEKRKPKW